MTNANYNHLTVNNAAGVNLGSDATLSGMLTLTTDLSTGGFTLTMPNTANSSGAGEIIGNIRRTGTGLFSLTYGNPFNTIAFSSGTPPTDITVNLVKAKPSGVIGFPTAVDRTYTITANGGGIFTATLRLHYLDSELGPNDEATLQLWRFNGTSWARQDRTSANTTENWVEKNNVTAFSPWTLNSTVPTAGPATISGLITRADGSPLAGAVMHLSGTTSRATITDANGAYHFDNLDAGNFYNVTPSLANYRFTPASRSMSLIGNTTQAVFTGDPEAFANANAIDTTEYFVRQQYLDFLGREPDQDGFEYWSSQINECNGDAACIRQRRIDVSAAFFASAEFQQTGAYVYGLYAGTLGRTPGFAEFNSDRLRVVGGAGLAQARTGLAESFVQRSEFTNRYPQSLTRELFVDAVLQTMQQRSGADMSVQRDALLNAFDTGGRAPVVTQAAAATAAVEYNKAFVLMEYFGYLRRDVDQGGYDFWLNVLNNRDLGNYRGMVCSFVTSVEYQKRFSTVVLHSNSECSGLPSLVVPGGLMRLRGGHFHMRLFIIHRLPFGLFFAF